MWRPKVSLSVFAEHLLNPDTPQAEQFFAQLEDVPQGDPKGIDHSRLVTTAFHRYVPIEQVQFGGKQPAISYRRVAWILQHPWVLDRTHDLELRHRVYDKSSGRYLRPDKGKHESSFPVVALHNPRTGKYLLGKGNHRLFTSLLLGADRFLIHHLRSHRYANLQQEYDESYFARRYHNYNNLRQGPTKNLHPGQVAIVKTVLAYLNLPLEQATVLDVGCAVGNVVSTLRELGVKAFGVDASAYALQNALPKAKPFLRQGAVDNLPYEDRQFDLITGWGVIKHLPPYRLTSAFRELMRVAKHAIWLDVNRTTPNPEKVHYHTLWDPDQWGRFFDQVSIGTGWFRPVGLYAAVKVALKKLEAGPEAFQAGQSDRWPFIVAQRKILK